ncbi:MAG: hypothetical protein GY759_24405 [Chloroflexi bacterium]|nr:hypothetical protein [Chloroflexota bacterium]
MTFGFDTESLAATDLCGQVYLWVVETRLLKVWLVYRSTGFPVYWSTGFPVYRFPGLQVSRSTGFPVYRLPGLPASRFPDLHVTRARNCLSPTERLYSTLVLAIG